MKTTKNVICLLFVSLLTLQAVPIHADDFSREKAPLRLVITGGDASQQTALRSALLPKLERTFDVMMGESAYAEHKLEITLGQRAAPTYNRKSKIHSCTFGATAYFYKNEKSLTEKGLGVGVSGSATGSKDSVCAGAVQRAAENIVRECRVYFPIVGSIRDIDEGIVYIDQGSTAGIEVNTFCDVYDENGDHRGVLETIRVTSDNSEARIVKGGGSIEVGNTVETRRMPYDFVISVEMFTVPVETEIGQYFASEYGMVGIPDPTSATGVRLGFGDSTHFKNKTAWSMGGGFLMMEGMAPFFFDGQFTVEQFLVFDRLSTFWNFGAGLMAMSGVQYVRPDGVDYGDGLKNADVTNVNWHVTLRTAVGLKLHLTKQVSLQASVGYHHTGLGDDWSKTLGEGENAETIELDSTWTKYDHVSFRGVWLNVGVSVMTF